MKVMVVFGTRPEAIKIAPLITVLKKDDFFDVEVVVTGQHREMLDQVLSLFSIIPDIDLNIMREGQDLYDVTSRILLGLRPVLSNVRPDVVLVHGDTATTFAASLAAFYQKIPVGHVEAGLRTDSLYSPWPEEGNRQLTSRLARWHFAPTKGNKATLEAENIQSDSILVTGNTVVDALRVVVNKISECPELKFRILNQLMDERISESMLNSDFVLITGHRRESFGEGFKSICTALRDLAIANPYINFVYPAHLNPNVQKPVKRILNGINNIFLINPLGYEAFVYLMQKCYLVLTDSGGIQEEAPGLGKPVLVMRETTERQEAIDAGTVKLVGTDAKKIFDEVQELLDQPCSYMDMERAENPFGDGFASDRIVNFLKLL